VSEIRLSVIIVNYNVKYFLEQALASVHKSIGRIKVSHQAGANASGTSQSSTASPVEILVVDNNSVDRSPEMVRQKFPEVILIENKENVGFARANNQALARARGEYVLFLNPDTIVEEDTFKKILAFMDSHPEAGALGVKMIDGKGNFAPESKRSFPTPAVAFYKLFGLSRLFPKSRVFGKYHLGYLHQDEIHEVEVLSGAFMLVRRQALDRVGPMDEAFFMYAEDIDLSFRIIEAGYKNYYFPETRIIHYKGESTRRGSLNYIRMFYTAMILFARKHFARRDARRLTFLIHLAILVRAFMAGAARVTRSLFLPVLDIGLLYWGMYGLKDFWERNVKHEDVFVYPPEFMSMAVPAYIAIWLAAVYFSGGYDRPVRISKLVRGLIAGTIAISVIYAFLPEAWRFSRALILLGSAWAIFSLVGVRVLLHFLKYGNFEIGKPVVRKVAIVGNKAEVDRVLSFLNLAQVSINFIGQVTAKPEPEQPEYYLGTIDQLKDIVDVYGIDEVIFSSKDVRAQKIISLMSEIRPGVHYKIGAEDSLSIIGGSHGAAASELYAIDIDLAIASDTNRRNKRMLDLAVSCALVPLFPLAVFLVRNRHGLANNVRNVFIGRKTWVGYGKVDSGAAFSTFSPSPSQRNGHLVLPPLRLGVLTPSDRFSDRIPDSGTVSRLNLLYAKDYSIWQDMALIAGAWRELGRELD
jgi:GT2 family glycosyltransferase